MSDNYDSTNDPIIRQGQGREDDDIDGGGIIVALGILGLALILGAIAYRLCSHV